MNDATGPNRSVTGAKRSVSAKAEVFARALTPPLRENNSWLKKGLWPWVNAQGVHSIHHTPWAVSPQPQVIEEVG